MSKAGGAVKESFILYTKYKRQFELLSNEKRGELIMAIFEYVETREPPVLDGTLAMAFSFIRADIDSNLTKWEETCRKRAAAGSKGGRQRVAKQAIACDAWQNEAKQAEYENEGVYENDFSMEEDGETRAREYAAVRELYEHVFSIRLNAGQWRELVRLIGKYGSFDVSEAIEDVKARNIRDPLMYLGRCLKNHAVKNMTIDDED